MNRNNCIHKAAGDALVLFAALIIMPCLLTASCQKSARVAEQADGWCELGLASGNTATGLGPMDYYAGYNGFVAAAKPGERVVFHAQFPKARYCSVMVYDEHFLLLDSILDRDIVPLAGVNPFIPGTDRGGKYLGEFEIRVLMEPKPQGPRPPNTLYAGLTHDGKPNHTAIIGYRVYMQDQGYGYQDHNPLAVYGGVPAPHFRVLDKAGNPFCPSPTLARTLTTRANADMLWQNRETLKDPTLGMSDLANPPVWYNNASREEQSSLSFVPAPDTSYIMMPVSSRFGELLVFRWKAPRVPADTFYGKPFPEDGVDMRYWSLSFDYVNLKRWEKVFCERTVADIEVPVLPGGASQVVVGFNGMARPEAVPPEQWVGLERSDYLVVVRDIVVNPDYPGLFWNQPAGDVTAQMDRYTPGGVYCSAAEFAQDPDLGLRRKELLGKIEGTADR
ncbi:MAG TPA: hypothetical protein VM658_04880 [bacterium]|nr:hypothetical protein [bacterium]